MRLPFTPEQFLELFAAYNRAIWPAQLAAYALGLAALWGALRGGRLAARGVPLLLAGAWGFVGAAYHLAFFSRINPAAIAFGVAFLAQALLLGWWGVAGRAELGWTASPRSVAGAAAAGYALAVYPALGALLGHGWPRAPMFGVTPCPTTIFTFAILLLARADVPRVLLVVPILWSIVGASAALQLGIREDLGLPAAALAAAILLWPRRGATAGAAA